MKEVKIHRSEATGQGTRIEATDEAVDGVHSRYQVSVYVVRGDGSGTWEKSGTVAFQKGEVTPANLNGISEEALLAILLDRLGNTYRHSCILDKLREAMMWLQRS